MCRIFVRVIRFLMKIPKKKFDYSIIMFQYLGSDNGHFWSRKFFCEIYNTTLSLENFATVWTVWTWLVISKKIPMLANLYSHTGSFIHKNFQLVQVPVSGFFDFRWSYRKTKIYVGKFLLTYWFICTYNFPSGPRSLIVFFEP